MFTTLMSLSSFAQDNIYMYNGNRYNVKVIKEKYSSIIVRKDTIEFEISLNRINRIDLGANLPTLLVDTIKMATTKEWETEPDLQSFTKNDLIERAGVNLNAAGGCMLSGFIVAAVAPFVISSKDVVTNTLIPGTSPKQYIPITTKEYDYTPAYVCLGVAAGLELAAMICFMSAGSNLQQAANAPDKKTTYRLSPMGGSICFRF